MDQAWQQTWDVGLAFIRWLQESYPQLEQFFFFITNLGGEEFYLALFPLIFWCIHKPLGRQLGYVFLFTVLINSTFKQAFRGPRPFWLDDTIALDTREEGYGMPSGHTQNAAILYFFIANWVKQKWVWALAIVMVLLMALSRIYLATHFLHDTILGLLLALVTLAAFVVWQKRYSPAFNQRILGQRLIIAVLVPMISLGFFMLLRLLIGDGNTAVPWARYLSAAERSSMDGAAQGFGLLLGFSIGIIFEASRIRFRADGRWWQRILRYLVGIVGLVGIWAGLKQLFPEDPLWIGLFFRTVRYFLLAFWAAYIAPWLFIQLRLAQADPEPTIDVSIRSK